jgi:hypothetical protein
VCLHHVGHDAAMADEGAGLVEGGVVGRFGGGGAQLAVTTRARRTRSRFAIISSIVISVALTGP